MEKTVNTFEIEIETFHETKEEYLDSEENIQARDNGILNISLDGGNRRGSISIKAWTNQSISVRQNSRFYRFSKRKRVADFQVSPNTYTPKGDYERWDTLLAIAYSNGFTDEQTIKSIVLSECWKHQAFREGVKEVFPKYYKWWEDHSDNFCGTIIAQCTIYTGEYQNEQLTYYLDKETKKKTSWTSRLDSGGSGSISQTALINAKKKLLLCLKELDKMINKVNPS